MHVLLRQNIQLFCVSVHPQIADLIQRKTISNCLLKFQHTEYETHPALCVREMISDNFTRKSIQD